MNKITDINFANGIMLIMKKIFKYIPYVLLASLLSGCYEKDFSTPAQNQIDEYRTMGKMCLVNNKPSSTTNSTSNSITGNLEIAENNITEKDENISQNQDTESSSTSSAENTSDKQIEESGSTNVSSHSKTEYSGPEKKQQNVESDTKGTMFGIQDGDIVFGNPDAQVVVIEYSSPTCLHCAYYHKEILPVLKKKYIDTKTIAYLIRPFISNKQDLDAAVLTRCTTNNDDYLKMVNVLYQKQDSWAYHSNYRDILTNIGGLAAITPENYEKCLNDKEISDYLINNSRAISHVPKFIGTPSFVVDGQILDLAYSEENLSALIDKAIKKYEEKKSAISQ